MSDHLVKLVLVSMLLLAVGCDDEADPVDIPFEGHEVSGEPRDATTPPAPASGATASATSASRPAPRGAGGTGIAGCCVALASAAKIARDEGSRAMYEQAAKVCQRRSSEVRAGKLSKSEALAQVRSSLLGSAPPSCR